MKARDGTEPSPRAGHWISSLPTRSGDLPPKRFSSAFPRSPEIRRRLRDIHAACLDRQKYVVITSPCDSSPTKLSEALFSWNFALRTSSSSSSSCERKFGESGRAGTQRTNVGTVGPGAARPHH